RVARASDLSWLTIGTLGGAIELTCEFAGGGRRGCALKPPRAAPACPLTAGRCPGGCVATSTSPDLITGRRALDQAAIAPLDRLPASQWPTLAAKRLAAG